MKCSNSIQIYIQSEHVTSMYDGGSGIWREVSLWDSGEEGPSSFGLERVVADHRQGLGEGVRLPSWAGTGTVGPSFHGPGGHLEPSAAAASTLPSQWHLLPFSPPFSLYFSRRCVSTAAKILLLQYFAWAKGKLQVYCQHSEVSKHHCWKKVFIHICPSYSVLLNNTF